MSRPTTSPVRALVAGWILGALAGALIVYLVEETGACNPPGTEPAAYLDDYN